MAYAVTTIMKGLKSMMESLIFKKKCDMATAMKGLKTWLGMLVFHEKWDFLPVKQRSELYYWYFFIKRLIKWYQGRSPLYYHPSPADRAKITGYSLKENAIRTWIKVDANKYLDRLLIPRDYFEDMRILDVGCGPIPYALVFTGCEIFGLDQLVELYKGIGYPLDSYSDRMNYINGCAEKIPVEDGFFDAVISVNAIDHADDFGKAAKEISRVLKPGGILRFEVHYHKPTLCEPWQLNDDMVLRNFGHLGIRKVCERDAIELHYDPSQKGEKLVVWENK